MTLVEQTTSLWTYDLWDTILVVVKNISERGFLEESLPALLSCSAALYARGEKYLLKDK